MSGCEEYESLLKRVVLLGSDLTVARDQLALTSKRDSRAYQSVQSRFEEAERKWKHARKELLTHKDEHRCINARREFPRRPVGTLRDTGSFDYVGSRLTPLRMTGL